MKALFSLFQALLFAVSCFSVKDSGFKAAVDSLALRSTGESNFVFDGVSADDVRLTAEDIKLCRKQFDDRIINASAPLFDFRAGGKSFSKNLSDWSVSVLPESAAGEVRKGGKTAYITYAHKLSGLEVTVEATIYEQYATCEWTVFIKNTSNEKSPVISAFNAVDTVLETGKSTLFVSKGSMPGADDFTLYKTDVNYLPMRFNANGGRSGSFLPFFNINGKDGSAVVSVSWTGQWLAKITQKRNGVSVKAGQESFKAYLEPGEEVRSPLISYTAYGAGSSPLKGFNAFRSWVRDCVYPGSVRPDNGIVIANEFNTLTTDGLIDKLNSYPDAAFEKASYFWMDAGWYTYNEGWYDGVGNWTADSKRFPEGLKPLSDAMAEKGQDFLLWYEPERVREGTVLYNEGMKHKDWVVQIDDNLLWNLGNGAACEFLSEYILASMRANGVGRYRQDFNFTPVPFWEKIDRQFNSGRKGIAENHYVTNLYRYLDYLIENIDGLVIDNCASGGKRLDIEMSRRSIPLWRSDYNCGNSDGTLKPDILEATQSMTYGLSFWLPYSGTNVYVHDEYAARTGILTNPSYYEINGYFGAYEYQQSMMKLNYFPLACGGLDSGRFLAYQFGDEKQGTVIIYKRPGVKEQSFDFSLCGLNENSDYVLTDIDGINADIAGSGKTLMAGVSVNIPDTPKCAVFNYREKSR